MKWYWWLLIAIILIVVITLVVRSNKAKQSALNQIAANTQQPKSTFNPFDLSTITAKNQ